MLYKQTYEEVTAPMTPEEKKEYDNSITPKH